MVTVRCKYCGKKFKTTPSELKAGKGKFCSIQCYGNWKRKKNHPEVDWNELVHLYVEDKLSMYKIAKKLGLPPSTVWLYLKKVGVARKRRRNIPKEELEELYLERKLSTLEIAKIKNVHPSVILYKLKKYGIPVRNLSDAAKLARKKYPSTLPPPKKGPNHPCWKGGRRYTTNGYVLVYAPNHPRAHKKSKCVFEHILVWEKTHGKPLPPNYQIHHLNGIKDDNRPENLVAVPSNKHPQRVLVKQLQARIRELEACLTSET